MGSTIVAQGSTVEDYMFTSNELESIKGLSHLEVLFTKFHSSTTAVSWVRDVKRNLSVHAKYL